MLIEPQRQYRFRLGIRISADMADDVYYEIMQNVISCRMDYANRTVDFVLRQPITGMHKTALDIAQLGIDTLKLDLLDGDAQTSSVVFRGLSCVSHNVFFSYLDNAVVEHSFHMTSDNPPTIQYV